jgi:sugar phosphate isomerase/epimerase
MFCLNRRKLLGGLLALPLLPLAEARGGVGAKPLLKLSCNLFTFNSLLSKGEMTLPQVIDYCAELGFEAVDPTGYYFPGYPEVPDDDYINQIKRQTFLLGLDISGTGVRNNFAVADPAKRRADVGHVKQWIEISSKLGAPLVRVFAGRQDAGHPETEIDKWVIDALRECSEYGSRFGVILALQNHRDFIDTADHFIRVLEAVDSPWIGAHLDIGGFRTADPYDDIAKAIPYAVTWQIKENVFFHNREAPTDIPRLLEIIRKGGYRGYLPLETLGEGDPRAKISAFLKRFRQAMGSKT